MTREEALKIIEANCGDSKPQNALSYIKNTMRYLIDKGCVNATHEQVEIKYGSRNKKHNARKEE